MHNSVMTSTIFEIIGIAAFVAAIFFFDATLVNNDPSVACLFLGMCLFGCAGFLADSNTGTVHVIATVLGAVGASAFAIGICMGIAGSVISLLAIAFGIVAIMSSAVFRMACIR